MCLRHTDLFFPIFFPALVAASFSGGQCACKIKLVDRRQRAAEVDEVHLLQGVPQHAWAGRSHRSDRRPERVPPAGAGHQHCRYHRPCPALSTHMCTPCTRACVCRGGVRGRGAIITMMYASNHHTKRFEPRAIPTPPNTKHDAEWEGRWVVGVTFPPLQWTRTRLPDFKCSMIWTAEMDEAHVGT